jgi:glycosyltransferase involved in cell wall biosynthesis
MNFKVSVIIPAFNAGTFIHKAVSSALEQPQVREVLVIDDGSTDQTKEVLQSIKNKKLRVLTHENGVNKGRSCSRNLGLKKATSDYIAFLDADDYYLPHRFDKDELIFKNNKCDGVYNAIGSHFYRKGSKEEHVALKLNTLSRTFDPNDLAIALVKGHYGYFSIIGFTVKKYLIDEVGYFNPSLKVAEDTEFLWKLAFIGKLVPGNLEQAVANRGVHNSNSFNNHQMYEQFDLKLFESMYFWSLSQKFSLSVSELFLQRIMIIEYKKQYRLGYYFKLWVQLLTVKSRVLFSYLAFKYFPLNYKWKSIKTKLNLPI